MKTLIDELQLRDPITAFNGGLVVRPDLSVIREHLVPSEAAQAVIDILTKAHARRLGVRRQGLVCQVTSRPSRGSRRVDGQVSPDRRVHIRGSAGSSRQDRRCQ